MKQKQKQVEKVLQALATAEKKLGVLKRAWAEDGAAAGTDAKALATLKKQKLAELGEKIKRRTAGKSKNSAVLKTIQAAVGSMCMGDED
jgi:hypothetical protein